MIDTKKLLEIVPALHSAQLVNENVKMLEKKRIKTKDVVGLGMKNIVGVSLIKMESDLISTL